MKNSTALAALGLGWAGLVNIPPPWAANIDYSEMSHDTDPTPDTTTNNMHSRPVNFILALLLSAYQRTARVLSVQNMN